MKKNILSDNQLYPNNNLDNIISQVSNNICNIHNKEFSFYCKICRMDICFFCQNNHINHELINYQNILPQNEEIKLLIDSIKKYNDDYNNLLNAIFSWRKEIDKIIIFYQDQLKNNTTLNNNINFILNYNYYKMNYNSILKFRQIYSNIIEPKRRTSNNKKLNYMTKDYEYNELFYNESKMGLFDYNNYCVMKFCLDRITSRNDEINFVNNSNFIIKILWDTFINSKNEKNIYNNIIYNYNSRTMYKRNNTNSLSDGNLLRISKNIFFNDKNMNNNNYEKNYKNNIIEKIIDLSSHNKIKEELNKEDNINYNNNNKLYLTNNIGNIFLEQNSSGLKLSSNLYHNNTNEDNQIINKTSTCLTPLVKHNLKPLNLNSFSEKKMLYTKKKSNSQNKWNKKNRSNSFNYNENNNNFVLNNNNENTQITINNKEIVNKYLPKIKVHSRVYINKDNQGKTYVHKKFDPQYNNKLIKKRNSSGIYNSPKTPDSFNRYQSQDSYEQNDTVDNKLNNTFTLSENCQKKLNFDILDNNINNKSTLNIESVFKSEKKIIKNMKINPINKRYNNNTYDPSLSKIEDNYNFNIIKNPFQNKYIIDPNKPLCVGLELGNNNCKISIFNQNESINDNIEVFCFKEDKYSIPIMLSFTGEKNQIEIGYDSYESFLDNYSKTIFNIMKVFGKNYNQISFNKTLYPFRIYSNEKIPYRPYIKIDYHSKKDKKFYFEDLFTVYIKKLFEKFFTEIELENKEKDKNIIQLVLVVSVPDYFNYFQRKIIEKLFQTQIFPEYSEINNNIDNRQDNISITSSKLSTSLSMTSSQSKRKNLLYGGYKILLKDIKIENCSSIVNLCLKTNNEKLKNNLTINITGDSINISISSIYQEKNDNKNIKDIYEVKIENNIQKGEEDFIDNFIEQKLKLDNNNNNKNNDDEKNIIYDICKLRKNCYEIIQDINKKNDLSSEKNNERNEFIKSLNDVYNEIILTIKKMLKKEKMNENNINHILLIGPISKTDSFIQMLKKLFKYNKEILNQLYQIEKINNTSNKELFDDFLVASGAAIQSYNLINADTKHTLIDICPISFGIETLDGLVEFVIEKGVKIPIINQKFIKIKKENEKNKNSNYLEINIYEGENKEVIKNKLISCVNIDKRNFKNEKICNNYIELLIQFEIDKYFNLRVYVLEPKTLKRRFECLINIDIVKG